MGKRIPILVDFQSADIYTTYVLYLGGEDIYPVFKGNKKQHLSRSNGRL